MKEQLDVESFRKIASISIAIGWLGVGLLLFGLLSMGLNTILGNLSIILSRGFLIGIALSIVVVLITRNQLSKRKYVSKRLIVIQLNIPTILLSFGAFFVGGLIFINFFILSKQSMHNRTLEEVVNLLVISFSSFIAACMVYYITMGIWVFIFSGGPHVKNIYPMKILYRVILLFLWLSSVSIVLLAGSG